MNYEKAYKDAVSKIKSIIADKKKQGLTNCLFEGDLNEIFPELASDDEQIKKSLIAGMQALKEQHKKTFAAIPIDDCIAWLEKQGEKSTIIDVDKMVKEYSQTRDGNFELPMNCMIRAYRKGINDVLRLSLNLEKQGEQKPTNIEPKFKVGDWVVFNNDYDSVYQVEKIENYEYTLRHILGGSMPLSFSHGNMIRAWTIQDAKDGDVLADDDSITIFRKIGNDIWNDVIDFYICYNSRSDKIIIQKDALHCGTTKSKIIKPATKKQRDLLFQKMKEAGYEWDSDKKVLVMIGVDNDKEDERYEELMKDNETDLNIKQNSANSYCKENCKGYQETGKCFADGECKAKRDAEQKPAWSEEDEKMIHYIIEYLERLDRPTGNSCIKWLKSLKPQNHWKPTDEQMEDFKLAIVFLEDYGYSTCNIKLLYEHLKKL